VLSQVRLLSNKLKQPRTMKMFTWFQSQKELTQLTNKSKILIFYQCFSTGDTRALSSLWKTQLVCKNTLIQNWDCITRLRTEWLENFKILSKPHLHLTLGKIIFWSFFILFQCSLNESKPRNWTSEVCANYEKIKIPHTKE